MISPKEKAEELFITYIHKGMNQIQPVINRVIRKDMAKQCALIAVQEILENYYKNHFQTGKKIDYWIEVKEEIEKL